MFARTGLHGLLRRLGGVRIVTAATAAASAAATIALRAHVLLHGVLIARICAGVLLSHCHIVCAGHAVRGREGGCVAALHLHLLLLLILLLLISLARILAISLASAVSAGTLGIGADTTTLGGLRRCCVGRIVAATATRATALTS